MFAKYDLKYLEDDTPSKMYGEAEGIYTLAHKDFAKKNPEVAQWIKNFKMNDKEIGALEDLINQTPNDIQGAVKKWIADNQDLVNSWLE